MANDILGTRSPNGEVGVRGVADSGELSMLSAGILSGFGITIGSGFNLTVGGSSGVQDVAVAKNSAGESDLLVGNGLAMTFALPGAPGTSGQSQVHSLVVWKDTTVVSTVNDGLDAVGLQVVSGAAVTMGSQVVPTEVEIRAAIPNGSTAFMVVVANITLNYGDTVPVASRITTNMAKITANQLPLDFIFPVGYVWQSTKNVNPNTFLGGTWTAFGQGRVLVGVGSNGTNNYTSAKATGGADNVTLTTAQMPSHTHIQDSHNHTQDPHNHIYGDFSTAGSSVANAITFGTKLATTILHTNDSTAKNQATTATNKATGGGGLHENRMPYITVYMWERTA